MKKAKLRVEQKNRIIKEESDSYSVKSMILIILIIVAVLGIFYFITTMVVKPSEEQKGETPAVIDNQMITLNHLTDRKEKEYYVLATKSSLYDGYSKADYIDIYNKYILDYQKEEESLKFYRVDLDDALNKNYLGEKTNIEDSTENLKLSDEVLFKIENGKIQKSYVGNKEISFALSKLKES